MDKSSFLKAWKTSGLAPLEAALRFGVDPQRALLWVREHREDLARPSLEDLLVRLLRNLAQLKRKVEEETVPADLIPELSEALRAIRPLEEAYERLLIGEEAAQEAEVK